MVADSETWIYSVQMGKPTVMSLIPPPYPTPRKRAQYTSAGQIELQIRPAILWPWLLFTKIIPPTPPSKIRTQMSLPLWNLPNFSMIVALRGLTSNCIPLTLNYIIIPSTNISGGNPYDYLPASGRSLSQALNVFLFVCIAFVLIAKFPNHSEEPDK